MRRRFVVETYTRGRSEDRVTGSLEAQTSKLPSSAYLFAALGCMAASATLQILGRDDWALFIGQWAPSILIMGVYNKQVKQLGSGADTHGVAA
jgi:hypothetical protein